MDLILWRHADAEEGERDLERKLTGKGHKQAARMGEWLTKRLPSRFLVLSSPARRARETADALNVRYRIVDRLAPGAAPADILDAACWPTRKGAVVVVGHQPDLGRVVSMLLAGADSAWSVRKAGLWWIADRKRVGKRQLVLRAVIAPDLL